MIKIKSQVINRILRHLNRSLDSAAVMAAVADPIVVVIEAVATPQGATLFNVNYATSRATRASIVGTASTKTSNHLHRHHHRMRTLPPHILLPS